MYDDVIIGKGRKGISAIKHPSSPERPFIAENRNCYWVSELYLDAEMTIFKDTPEGETLTSHLERGSSPSVLCKFLDDLVLTRMSPDQLRRKIEAARLVSYHRGSEARALQIRTALGIDGR